MVRSQITILFAYRNRDSTRVRLSLESLRLQTYDEFKVIFIDYGSQESYSNEVKVIVNKFEFTEYYYIGHTGLLWNKSKALNFGIRQSQSKFIITADVDVIFTKNFVETASKLAQPNSFSLFKIGYLSKKVTEQLQHNSTNLNTFETTHVGDTFGVGLFAKATLEAIGGLNEFFHFYGSEDEDLNYRVRLFGATPNNCDAILLYHQWHERYPQKKDYKLTVTPRLKNILRINQRQFLWNKIQNIVNPNPITWGHCYQKKDAALLVQPEFRVQLDNISSHVEHFFGEAIKKYSGSVVQIEIIEAPYFDSVKHRLKKIMGKQTQSYMTMKSVNDLILKEIVFRYRDYNYAYFVSKDLKEIQFIIDI